MNLLSIKFQQMMQLIIYISLYIAISIIVDYPLRSCHTSFMLVHCDFVIKKYLLSKALNDFAKRYLIYTFTWHTTHSNSIPRSFWCALMCTYQSDCLHMYSNIQNDTNIVNVIGARVSFPMHVFMSACVLCSLNLEMWTNQVDRSFDCL